MLTNKRLIFVGYQNANWYPLFACISSFLKNFKKGCFAIKINDIITLLLPINNSVPYFFLFFQFD